MPDHPELTPDHPKLAVVIPCYNYEAFVERAVRSVLDQGRADCEVVVVDDGSTDGSWEAIRRTGAPAFKIDNGGSIAACLFGLDRTRAPFVLFLDADDELKPGAIGAIIERLDPNVAKLQFPLTLIDADSNRIGGTIASLGAFRCRDELVRHVLRRGAYTMPPTSGNVFRRDLCEFLRDVDYDTRGGVDGVISFAAPLLGDVVGVPEELGCYRIHGRNASGMGRGPEAGSLQFELRHFVARMEHLRKIIRRLQPDLVLVDPRDTFYFRERNFYLELVSSRRPRLASLLKLLAKLADEPLAAKSKIGLATLFVLASVLPNNRSRALLAYRFKPTHRSMLGFLKEIVGAG
jgi:glycosyltransferase involved in cell wall biosynthesis